MKLRIPIDAIGGPIDIADLQADRADLIAANRRLAAALRTTGWPRTEDATTWCWCLGGEECVDEPHCVAARAALAECEVKE